MTFSPRFNKFGLKEDYTGAQVVTQDNRLAEIKRIYTEPLPGDMGWTYKAELRHFNGEDFETVKLLSLRILDRTWNA